MDGPLLISSTTRYSSRANLPYVLDLMIVVRVRKIVDLVPVVVLTIAIVMALVEYGVISPPVVVLVG
jgi:hypothetical protein